MGRIIITALKKVIMKIINILNTGKATVSCELFPPKYGSGLVGAKSIVQKTAALNPAFISVTYGAGGGTSEHSVSLADEAQNNIGITSLAHLTCVSSCKETIIGILTRLSELKIENILALRGDIAEGSQFPKDSGYHHACDLMKEIREFGGFCIGGACYPEGHPESESIQKDIESLKIKVECGCQFLTTQMFFDNNILYNFLYHLLNKKIDVPVIAGIMPVVDGKQIARICGISGTALPPRFRAIVDKFSSNQKAMCQAGIAYATEQIIDLIANDVNHIHIYTMNKPDIAGKIIDNLSEILK
ncbi:MAG: methylenetetrahydrofolate reductase [Treponema sp.]|nr:methylenetetrahydrofolate reductase [Treponema sp.]